MRKLSRIGRIGPCSQVPVSIRINKKDRDTLREAGVDVSAETRKHLEQIATEIRARKALGRLNKLIKKKMPPAPHGYGQRSVREDRESH